jgi:hypothetical protein
MTHRHELVILITQGTPPAEIYSHFANTMGRGSILELLKSCGVTLEVPPTKDEISDERRKFLQELSSSD